MAGVIDFIYSVISQVSEFIYRPYIVPLLLVGAGIIFTISTKFIQIRLFKEMISVVMEKPSKEGGMSSFSALMVSTASRVGTGNILGVSTAICLGGPGALVWMWITAFLGGASAFIESTLAQIYKKRDTDGSCYGGPSYYMKYALKAPWLGTVFSVIVIITYAVGYNMLAAYNLQSAFEVFYFYNKFTPIAIGIILGVLFGAVILGGAKRLSDVTGFMVPVMGVVYVLVSIVVLIINYQNLGSMFKLMFDNAFDFESIIGGFTGSGVAYALNKSNRANVMGAFTNSCLYLGLKRGLYSNEAGMGSAPNAAASADVSHPVKQGLVQMLSVFIDTLLICSATGLMCLSTGIAGTKENAGAIYIQECLSSVFGVWGYIFITFSLCLFAFTTLVGNIYYCEGCIKFLFNKNPGKNFMLVFRVIATVLVFLGTVLSAEMAWDTADMLQGFMVIINIPVILLLIRPALYCLKDYITQKKSGINPVFYADKNYIKTDTDYWNK